VTHIPAGNITGVLPTISGGYLSVRLEPEV
jgi:hypothetical protein